MKTKFLPINTINILGLACILGIATSLPVKAEGEKQSSRFSFAPHYYAQEHNEAPPQTPHSVTNGAVPGQSMLGLDPNYLKPVPRPQVQTRLATHNVSAQIMPSAVPKGTYIPAFGSPVAPAAPVNPMKAQPQQIVAHVPAQGFYRPVHHSHAHGPAVNTSVSAHLNKPAVPEAQKANQDLMAKAPDAYDKNFGYEPGTYNPAGTGDGVTTQANVHAQLLRKHN